MWRGGHPITKKHWFSHLLHPQRPDFLTFTSMSFSLYSLIAKRQLNELLYLYASDDLSGLAFIY